ncbi:MAG: hypothetical protein M3Q92_16955, partial [Actinomycetota bacterium]|nr:hypothetical protein [Actinomycetota bacterium]
MRHDTVLVVAGGGSAPITRELLPPADAVVAADGGVDLAQHLIIIKQVVVGDMDSASPSGLAAAEAA